MNNIQIDIKTVCSEVAVLRCSFSTEEQKKHLLEWGEKEEKKTSTEKNTVVIFKDVYPEDFHDLLYFLETEKKHNTKINK